jgi:RimK family alpha-L-glutamate ligase
MKGLLFYDTVGRERNAWFIEQMTSAARESGCELELIVADGHADAIAALDESTDVDFAIVRTIQPSLSLALEERGIPTFNNARVARIANDKWQTYLYSKELGAPVMATESISGKENWKPELHFPLVIKTVDGHGGSEVFLADNAAKCNEILAIHGNKRFIAQELSSEPGVDMRVYMLGDRVLAAVKRTSKSDFRSNFSLGGNAELTVLEDSERQIVERIAKDLGSDLIGIDFIRHNGGWVLNEIEDVVGTRML